MGSVSTRAKPNCFNALHQLSRRLKQGEKLSAVVGSADAGSKVSKSIFGMGLAESGAVVNLVHHLPLECRAVFGKAVAEFGIAKGPVTHAALAAHQIRVGYQPELISDDWSMNMRNTEESVIRASKRLVEDFRQAPLVLDKDGVHLRDLGHIDLHRALLSQGKEVVVKDPLLEEGHQRILLSIKDTPWKLTGQLSQNQVKSPADASHLGNVKGSVYQFFVSKDLFSKKDIYGIYVSKDFAKSMAGSLEEVQSASTSSSDCNLSEDGGRP